MKNMLELPTLMRKKINRLRDAKEKSMEFCAKEVLKRQINKSSEYRFSTWHQNFTMNMLQYAVNDVLIG